MTARIVNIAKKIALIAITLLIVLVIVFGVWSGYSVWAKINTQERLIAALENALSDEAIGLDGSVESAELSFRFSTTPLRLKAKNIHLTTPDASLDLPSSEFGFSLLNIMTGDFVPSDMWMSGLEIEIAHGEDGWQFGPSMALVSALVANDLGGDSSDGVLASIDDVHITNASIKINRKPNTIHGTIHEKEVQAIVLAPLNMSMRYEGGRVSGFVSLSNSLGGSLKVDFEGEDDNLQFTAELKHINMENIYPYLGIDIPEISTIGQVDGRLTLALKERRIASLSGDLTTGVGETFLPSFGRIGYSAASILFFYDAETDFLAVSNFDMTTVNPGSLRSGHINFSGEVRQLSSQNPLVIAKLRGRALPFERLMRTWPEDHRPALRNRLENTLKSGTVASLGVDVVGRFDRANRLLDVETFDLVSELRAVDLDTGFSSIQKLNGTLSARLELSIGHQGRIDHAAADLILRDVRLKTISDDDTITLEGIELRAVLEGNVISIKRGAIDAKELGQLALISTIELEPDLRPHKIDMSIRAEQIDKNLFVHLWPQAFRPRTRQVIANRIDGGRLNGLSLRVGFDLPRDAPPQVSHLDGKAQLVDTAFGYIESMPPITEVGASLSFKKSFLRADFLSGLLNGIDVVGSRVIVREHETLKNAAQIDVAMLAKGDVGKALNVLGHPKLNLLRGVPTGDTRGNLDASISMKWVVAADGQGAQSIDDIDVNFSANVSDAVATNLPAGIEFTEGNFDLLMSSGQLNISGRGRFDDVPVVMSLVYNKGKNLDVMVNAPDQEALMTAKIKVVDGQDVHSGTITLASEFLDLDGRVFIDDEFAFLKADFDHVDWPNNEVNSIRIERSENSRFTIFADVKTIDLRPFREAKTQGKLPIDIDLIAERIRIDDNIELSGHVNLTTEEDGMGVAKFLGTVFVEGKVLMEESSLTARFGSSGDFIEGRGLVGSSETWISFSPSDIGGNLLVLRSDNGGQVLKVLGFTDAVRGGKLDMMVDLLPSQIRHRKINIELEDFYMIEAPRSIRALSVLSLAGMFSLLEGDGTRFENGHAEIEILGDEITMHSVRASGQALAVDFVGLYNQQTKLIDVSGALLPIYGITQFLGRIPLVGEILTGVDNAGLLVTQFNVKGHYDDPETTINASSIIPGIFRDVFSPDWVNSERERLIGTEN